VQAPAKISKDKPFYKNKKQKIIIYEERKRNKGAETNSTAHF
jgi:hypothetical protein